MTPPRFSKTKFFTFSLNLRIINVYDWPYCSNIVRLFHVFWWPHFQLLAQFNIACQYRFISAVWSRQSWSPKPSNQFGRTLRGQQQVQLTLPANCVWSWRRLNAKTTRRHLWLGICRRCMDWNDWLTRWIHLRHYRLRQETAKLRKLRATRYKKASAEEKTIFSNDGFTKN